MQDDVEDFYKSQGKEGAERDSDGDTPAAPAFPAATPKFVRTVEVGLCYCRARAAACSAIGWHTLTSVQQ